MQTSPWCTRDSASSDRLRCSRGSRRVCGCKGMNKFPHDRTFLPIICIFSRFMHEKQHFLAYSARFSVNFP